LSVFFPVPRKDSMTKKDMVKEIAKEMGLTRGQAGEVVQRVFDGITDTLLSEGRIELRNFGVFEVRRRKPRRARNPRTGGESVGPGQAGRHLQGGAGDGGAGRPAEERAG
jgi:nucleoid DNA-binding protein